MDLTTPYSWAGAQALRDGMRLAAHSIGTYRDAALLLRGSPFAVGWLAGWLSTEFPPQAVAGHLMSRVAVAPVCRVATTWAAQHADRILTQALRESLGENYRELVHHPISGQSGCAHHGILAHCGILQTAGHHHRYAARTSNIAYGPGGHDHLLDVWRQPRPRAGRDSQPDGRRMPVLIQVPGGGWTIGDKRGQAYPLMSRMAELGWICVSINYRKSPRSAWPAHINDVKRAIAWVRDNIADYGGDPGFIAITGGSAGAHLSSLAALTANDPRLQPGFEEADTTVQAAAPYYGMYDFTKPEKMHQMMLPFLEHFVMQTRYTDNPGLFESASPISHAHRGAPPFFVLHGANDSLTPSAQAQTFSAALREAGATTVCYAELPHAHHAFDTIATIRSQFAAEAVAEFLGVVYGRYVHSRADAPYPQPVSAS